MSHRLVSAGGVERSAGNVIVFTGRDMNEVSRFFQAVENINRVEP